MVYKQNTPNLYLEVDPPNFQKFGLLKNLKNCIITAESCSIELASDWMKCVPNCNIYNYYGPTEVTINCSYYKLNREKNISSNGLLSIGKLFKNLKKIIIDENGNILSNEKKGELCLSGDQVSPGYWKNQKKNKSSFFTTKFENVDRIFYKTGDICSINKDNNILLHGRVDSQIKIDGYRIGGKTGTSQNYRYKNNSQ